MLLELHLRNLGVIAEAHLELGPGLNVITGETGVGKTLLVTSLGLLGGARGNARLVYEKESEAVVEAVVTPTAATQADLASRGIDDVEELVLVRKLGADGRSRAWAGGQLVPMSTLAAVGERVLEIHGQGSSFALARPAAQLAALDALGRNDETLGCYREALGRYRELDAERGELRTDERTRLREIDVLSFQVSEIDQADLAAGEEEQLRIELARLEHAEQLGRLADDILSLAGAEGAAGDLATAHKSLLDAAALDGSATALGQRLGDVAVEASELARELRTWAEGLEPDPQRLELLRERKALLRTLKRKYGSTTEEILEVRDGAATRLDQLAHSDERRAGIDAEVDAARVNVERAAGDLTKRRKRAAKELTKLVSAELPALAMPNAVFEAACSPSDLTESGADDVEFLFSSSGARSPDLIGKIASGGELSRAMIAVTLALAHSHDVPVLVFDEADQGVGGEAALELARRLARLGRSHQVLVVSHLPQIAAFADRHLSVRRSGQDVVEVNALGGDGRIAEISRMLAGLGESDRGRAHAAELLELADEERANPQVKARAG
ncbi:MAG: DNA repair protein RecN [Actinomycetota bacterium]